MQMPCHSFSICKSFLVRDDPCELLENIFQTLVAASFAEPTVKSTVCDSRLRLFDRIAVRRTNRQTGGQTVRCRYETDKHAYGRTGKTRNVARTAT